MGMIVWNAFRQLEEQFVDNRLFRESAAGTNDAAPILLGEVVEIGGVEDGGAANDNLLEEFVVLDAFSKDAVEGIKPVDCQKP